MDAPVKSAHDGEVVPIQVVQIDRELLSPTRRSPTQSIEALLRDLESTPDLFLKRGAQPFLLLMIGIADHELDCAIVQPKWIT
jgi:hypothetical protein